MERFLHRSLYLCSVPSRALDLSRHSRAPRETPTLATARDSRCPGCQCVWLDAGELELVSQKERLRGGLTKLFE